MSHTLESLEMTFAKVDVPFHSTIRSKHYLAGGFQSISNKLTNP